MKTKSISLEEAKKLPITSMYLAVVKVHLSPDELEDESIISPFYGNKTTYKEAVVDVFEVHKQANGTLLGMSKDDFLKSKMQLFSESLLHEIVTVIAITEDGTIDLGARGIDFDTNLPDFTVPLNDYYSEGDYHFEIRNGRTVIRLSDYNAAKNMYKNYLREKLVDWCLKIGMC